jgi:DNA mismatch repair ATPase MutS
MAILLNVFFPWDIFFGYRMEIFKQDLVDCLPEWLDLWYELEALFGLANFAFLNPRAPFAEVIVPSPAIASATEGKDSTLENEVHPFAATNLGHPLISAEERIGNDFTVDHLGSMTIITGSNMAGKSSFLRTLGVNIRLALAGAPVLADSLTLQPFRVAASISVTDSVTDGFSFFYAEVRRLKTLLEELDRPHAYPLFFLIDEIFRGTNNRERLIGSRSYVKALLGGNGTGVIATHDLELVNLASVNADIRNAHFRDQVQGELMVFDYKLHEGPCPTTNALRIMEFAGLPVDKYEAVGDTLQD